jgi:hypothetical protein
MKVLDPKQTIRMRQQTVVWIVPLGLITPFAIKIFQDVRSGVAWKLWRQFKRSD